jgi:predicted negative regulator of RcsB-dependent stress response
VEPYSTEEEQLEALRRWWNENGRSTLTAVLFAVAAGFGWQAWKANEVQQHEQASDVYQTLVQAMETGDTAEGAQERIDLAKQLLRDSDDSTYAQFAALRLAALAVNDGKMPEAEAQLRWVLGKAAKGSDIAQVAQLRLARVLASTGDAEQALAILNEGESGTYAASYAAARGDILFAAGRNDEARDAYRQALTLAGGAERGLNLQTLQQKLQSLTPIPARTPDLPVSEGSEVVETVPETVDASAGQEE